MALASGQPSARSVLMGRQQSSHPFALAKLLSLTHTWGEVPYPVRYVFDGYGRLSEMHTWRADTAWDGATWPTGVEGQQDVTAWNYQEATGLLLSKEDALGQSVDYTYTSGGKLATRTWARDVGSLVTTYGYNPLTAELTSINYSDSTPDVAFTYDRLGRQKTVSDAVGSRTFTYNTALQPLAETITGLMSKTITRTYATAGVIGRATGFNTGADYSVTYGYDSKGRLNTVGSAVTGVTGTATYGYLANSDLLQSLTSTAGLNTTYSYEPNRDLRTQVKNQFGAGVVSQYDYEYDQLARRTSVKNSGSAFSAAAFSLFGYNDRNELGESARYLGTDLGNLTNPVSAEYRAFDYDPIGNRTTITEAVNPGSYTANPLNQYTQAVLPAGGVNTFTHDFDGNLTQISGVKDAVYTYDAENRLINAEPASPAAGDKRVDLIYDYMGRRFKKTVYNWTGSSWAQEAEKFFLYDGWNLAQETTTGLGTKYFVWGLDLSQGLQGAGGIGGLLGMVSDGSSYAYLFDGNGNVGQVVNNSGGAIEARYEYDPYGNTLTASGALAATNPYRFSTKYFDAEYGLYYYGFRYYDPETGRWLNRDPREEDGGLNLYGFVENEPTNSWDRLGLLKDGEVISSILVKRKNIRWLSILKLQLGKPTGPEDFYGHRWIEIDGKESYGWWPKNGVDLIETIFGVPGQLNGTDSAYKAGLATSTKDAHHGDSSDESFSPRVNAGEFVGFLKNELEFGSGKGVKCNCATEDQIKDSIRGFAAAYKGNWSYPLGQNCHSFQRALLRAACLREKR